MGVDRLTRLNQQLQRELGQAFEKFICPAVKGGLVTVTGVEVTEELKDATVYVSVYGSPAVQEGVMALLQKKRALLQSEIAHHVIMRYTPRLKFVLDHTAEKAARVMEIISELDKEEEARKTTAGQPDAEKPAGEQP